MRWTWAAMSDERGGRGRRSCVVLAPRCWRTVVMRRRVTAHGGKKAVPRGEHKAAVKTIRAGKAGMHRSGLWFLPRAFHSHGGHGDGESPAFPAPSSPSGVRSPHPSGMPCRETAAARLQG